MLIPVIQIGFASVGVSVEYDTDTKILMTTVSFGTWQRSYAY